LIRNTRESMTSFIYRSILEINAMLAMLSLISKAQNSLLDFSKISMEKNGKSLTVRRFAF